MKFKIIVFIILAIGIKNFLYSQNSDTTKLEKKIKELVFADAFSNGSIDINNIICYEYFTQKLLIYKVTSTGNCFNNFIFFQIQYDDSLGKDIIHLKKYECIIYKHSNYQKDKLIAFNHVNGNYYKLFGFRHNDFKWMINENAECVNSLMRKTALRKKYFLKKHSITGYNLKELINCNNSK